MSTSTSGNIEILKAKCAALLKINQEILDRCRPFPRLLHAEAHNQEIEYSWRWYPKQKTLVHFNQQLCKLGPFQIAFKDLPSAISLFNKMDDVDLHTDLLKLLEEHQVELGKLESDYQGFSCPSRLIASGTAPVQHLDCTFDQHNLVLGYQLLELTTDAKVLSHRAVACSWLALQLFGKHKIKKTLTWNRRPTLGVGIYMAHNSREFRGLALHQNQIYLFTFDQTSTHCFGNLKFEKRERTSADIGDYTSDVELLAQTVYYPLL